MRPWVGFAAMLVVLTLTGRASAQDKAAADTLFDEGRALMAQGKHAEACAKFEGSLQVMNQLGVRLNLADCYEKAGRTASAWSAFRASESQANKLGDARAGYAAQRYKALEPKLSRLVVKVAAPVPGLEVKRDGGIVPSAMYGTAVPVDPGDRVVVATADGYEEWRQTVKVAPDAQTVTVEIPELTKPGAVTSPPTGPAPEPVDTGTTDPGKSRRIIGLVTAGGGVALIAVSVVFGLGAKSAWSDAQDMGCTDDGVCPTQAALDQLDSARSKAMIGTIVGIGGVALVGTGIVLYLTAPKRREGVSFAPQVAPGYAGVTFGGQF